LDSAGGKAKLKLELWLTKGRLFSLVFNKPPKEFFAGGRLRKVQPTIADVKIWLDPMQSGKAPEKTARQETNISLHGWLGDWQRKGRVSELQVPLPSQDRVAVLERIDAVLPADYLELISQTEGVKLRDCVIHGAGKIRKVVSVDANYYILADTGTDGGLAVKEGDQGGALYALDYESDSVRQIGRSLKDAVAAILGILPS
jgi:hypothetical protein